MVISGKAGWFLLMVVVNISTVVIQLNLSNPLMWLIITASAIGGFFVSALIRQLIEDN